MNPWGSIRKSSAAEVRRLRAQNATLRAARAPLWLRLLGPLVTNRSLFRLLAAYFTIWSFAVLLGTVLNFETPRSLGPLAEELGKRETIRDLLSYMLGAQATMVGLIFPLALGMVTLIVQRDEGAATNADVQLYYDQSLAYAVGTSGITLAIALVVALLAPEAAILDLFGRAEVVWSISLALLMVLGFWLLANLVVTWQFLIISLSFIGPSYRAAVRRRFVATRVIPRHLSALLSEYAYVQIGEKLLPGAAKPTPFVMAGAAEGTRGDRAIAARFGRTRQLFDVRLMPLRLAVRYWAWRCRRAGEGPGSDKYDWMLGLAGPLDRTFRGDVLLCRRKGGVALGPIERWLIRRALVFRAPVERDDLGPSDILEELGDRVVVQIDRMAVTGFDHALKEMREFHRFLLTAYTIIDEEGEATSYAAYGSISAEHSNWVREYRRLFERAVAIIEREDSFIGSLAFMAANLVPSPKDNVPPWIVGGLYEFPQYMVHRIGHWLTAQRGPRGKGARALVPGPLPPQVAKAYRSVALRIVGANESALQAGARYAEVPDGTDEAGAWSLLARSWPILFKHIESAAYLIAASHWHEDDIGAELFAESFLHWRQTLGDIGEENGRYILRAAFLSSDLVDLDWQSVHARVTPLLLHPEFREATPATIYAAIVANLHADVRVVTACVLAGWAGKPVQIYGAQGAAKRLAGAIAPREGSAALDLVRTFVRLRMAEWSADKSGYVGLLDNLVRKLDGMIEGERVPGRVYSIESRFRVGSLAPDWFALVAALGDAASFASIEKWLSELGADEATARIGDDNLWQLQNWLTRTASVWSEPASRSARIEAIAALGSVLDSEAAGDGLHASLVAAADAINAHRTRRLVALPIAPEAIAALQSAAAVELGNLPGRIGLFPHAVVRVVEGRSRRATFKMTGVDKNQLVVVLDETNDSALSQRFADRLAGHAARLAWKPYFNLRRRRIAVGSLRALFETAGVEGAKIAAAGARPIVLMPTRNVDWPDLYDARREMGDAVMERGGDELPSTYLYTYAGVDFHRSGLSQPELFSDDLLEEIMLTAPDAEQLVAVDAKPEADPTDVTVTARISVSANWRDAEILVLARRQPRRQGGG